MRYLSLFTLMTFALCPAALAETNGLDVSFAIFQDKINLDYSGDIRETKFNGINIGWIQPLSPTILGGFDIGYLEMTQYSNPIPAGQTGSGEYLGLNLEFLMMNSPSFVLLTRLGYRYSQTRQGQSVTSDWNQGVLILEGTYHFNAQFSTQLGVGGIAIDGRESATGTITENQPFRAENPLLGYAGVQFGLDPDSNIGIQVDMGSLWGWQLIFRRIF